MAREVCIKVNGVTRCTGSPIRDCGCDRDASFKDPFSAGPERIAAPGALIEDITRVLETWARNGDPVGAADKLYAISAITRLILSPGVSLQGPFVIMSMDNGTEAGESSEAS